MWSKTVVVAMGVVASLAVAAISLGAIPGATGVIHGCYSKSNGSLRLIDADSGASCSTNKENEVSWNQQGPPGPPGPPGPANTIQVLEMTSDVQETADGFDLKTTAALCPDGWIATGGGYRFGAARAISAEITVTDSAPVGGDAPDQLVGWTTVAIAPEGIGHWELTAYAICAEETS